MQIVLGNAVQLFGALRGMLFSARAGQRWLFRPNRGWLGGDRITDRCILWICLSFAVMGVMLLTHEGQGPLQELSAARWPTVEGTIISMQMKERHSAWGAEWVPDITYYYVVSGRRFQNTQVTMSREPQWKSREEANDFLARYVARTTVRVYYNPRNFSQSVLEPGADGVNTTALGGILLIVLALSTLVIYDRMH
jgi:Protein of unknown function (DUF3592)